MAPDHGHRHVRGGTRRRGVRAVVRALLRHEPRRRCRQRHRCPAPHAPSTGGRARRRGRRPGQHLRRHRGGDHPGRGPPSVRRRRSRHAAADAGGGRPHRDRELPGRGARPPLRPGPRHGRDPGGGGVTRTPRGRGRRAGPGRHLERPARRVDRCRRVLQLLPGQEPRCFRRRGGGDDLRRRGRGPAALPAGPRPARRAATTTTSGSARTVGSTRCRRRSSRPSSAGSTPGTSRDAFSSIAIASSCRRASVGSSRSARRPGAATTSRCCGCRSGTVGGPSWPRARHRDRHPLPDPVPPHGAVRAVRGRAASGRGGQCLPDPVPAAPSSHGPSRTSTSCATS